MLALVALWRSPGKNDKSGATPEQLSTVASASHARRTPSLEKNESPFAPNLGPRTAFLDGKLMQDVRSAVRTQNGVALDRAFNALVDHIRAHPEQEEEYLAGLRAEPEEYVLRTLARAISESDALWGDRLAQTAIDLVKDSSFQQRQHIMLHLMGQFPEMRDDLFQAVIERSSQDPDSQVKTSAVVVFADWMETYPDRAEQLMGQVERVFHTATEEDVLGFTYQMLAMRKQELSRELHTALNERLKMETEFINGGLIAAALSAAPDDIRQDAIAHLQKARAEATDPEMQRELLLQLVALSGEQALPLLREASVGDSLLAQDARDYLALLSGGTSIEPEAFIMAKAVRDCPQGSSCSVHGSH